MRDIRGDLQDRAALLEEQISAHEAQFDKLLEQLKREHDARLEDIKAELDAVNRLIEHELRRLATAPAAPAAPAAPKMQLREPVQHNLHQPAPQHAGHQPATASQVSHRPQPPQAPTAPQPELPLADFLVRKLNEVGAMPRDDLRRLSLQEGYFIDVDTADRGVHATLLNVVKAGLIRQLPNGNFAPATVLDTIRLRRAM
jgi:hypothetical protein